MSEMKPCPFCGGKNVLSTELQDGLPFIAYCQCGAENEAENWNTRPIEDKLRKRIDELEAEQARWVMVSERLPNKSGWYLAGLIGWAGGYYTAEVSFDTETGLPWRSSVRDEVYCWLDGVPELPKPPEVQE